MSLGKTNVKGRRGAGKKTIYFDEEEPVEREKICEKIFEFSVDNRAGVWYYNEVAASDSKNRPTQLGA